MRFDIGPLRDFFALSLNEKKRNVARDARTMRQLESSKWRKGLGSDKISRASWLQLTRLRDIRIKIL
jgi:hypothetical protein